MSRNSLNFTRQLGQLNPAQLEAVQATEGPVLVFAGPGTGKTQILTSRIAHLLEQGVAPQNILALTFTNAGARNMQERLAQLIGPGGYQVNMTTFHSFCGNVIEQYSHIFPVEQRRGGAIGELDQFEVVREILEAHDFPAVKPVNKPLHHLRSIVSLITQYKREGVSPEQVEQQSQEGILGLDQEKLTAAQRRKSENLYLRNQDVARIYSLYEQHLRSLGQYDYEDMILWVRDALRTSEELRQEYQERYQYILVDEFQDTNQAQFQVLFELTRFWGDQANIFVVGDPNQSIYRFQGASISNVMQFWQLFPDAKVITLQEGYRCPPEIYEAAAQLIAHNSLTDLDPRLQVLEKSLRSQKTTSSQEAVIRYISHANPLAEALGVSEMLLQWHAAGVAWSDLAVLYRSHAHSVTLDWVLRQRGIPTVTQRGQDALQEPLVQAVLDLLEMILHVRNGTDSPHWAAVLLQPWWRFSKNDALKFLQGARKISEASGSVWWVLQHEETWTEIGVELGDQEQWSIFRDLWLTWQEEANQSVGVTIERVLSQAGVLSFLWKNEEWQVQLPSLLALIQTAQRWSAGHPDGRLTEFLKRVRAMQEHNVQIAPEHLSEKQDAVTLSTAHGAKGREWKHIVMLQVNDGVWSNVKTPPHLDPLPDTIPYTQSDKKEVLEDDRRLFYVALTRARETITLLSCEHDVRNEAVRELNRSQFVMEMGINNEPVKSDTSRIKSILPEVLEQHSTNIFQNIQHDWLRGLVQEFRLSVSALEAYLTCPVLFFFQYLVRLPQEMTVAQVTGTAVHNALEKVNRAVMVGEEFPSFLELKKRVEQISMTSTLSLSDRKVAAKQATELLQRYLEHSKETWKAPVATEHFFGKNPEIVFESQKLTGKVDAIQILNEVAQTVRVIDYKTGKRKTRSELVGKPNEPRQPVRQLVFYALLADLDPTFQYSVTEGVFEFLQPSDAGKYLPVAFEVTNSQKEELKDLLRTVRDELQSLKFINTEPCGMCEMCLEFGLQSAQSSEMIAGLSANLE